MARVVEQIPPGNPRHLKHTLVQARDGRYFKILTYRLYERTPPAEFQNFEVNVMECDSRGKFRELNVPYFRRFFRAEDAIRFHDELLGKFDETLEIPEPKEHGKKEEKEDAAH